MDEVIENTLPALVKKGLTEEEAKILMEFLDAGKPGILKYDVEKLGQVYCLGYTCDEIKKWFPEYPMGILLYFRLHYKWDELRAKYRQIVQQETLNAALATRMEGVRFLSDLLAATHVKWRKELLVYITDPKPENVPDCIPKNLYVYAQIMNMLGEMMPKFGGAKGQDEKGSPLVSVTVNSGNEKQPDIVISQASQEDIKQALMQDLQKAKHLMEDKKKK